MKVKLIHMAMLLFFVMSVMFLAQTQDGIGHDDPYDPDKENSPPPHKPPGHTHYPSIYVHHITGKPLDSGNCDPRGKHFSGTCGNLGDRDHSAWGFRYGGGTYADSPLGPDCDTQNVWYVRVNVEASTGKRHASVTVTPEIYLTHYDEDEGSWQGSASGTVTFSGVCYHEPFFYYWCSEVNREGDAWPDTEEPETGYLDLKVQKAKITKGDKKTFGAGFESNGAKLTAVSENTYETSYDDLHARGYCFKLKLNTGFFSVSSAIAELQDKSAEGNGQLMLKQIESDTARAEYKWTKWKNCPCGESKTYYY